MIVDKQLVEILVLLIQEIKQDPFELLVEECKPVSVPIIEKYFIRGFDRKDYWQEANQVLFESVESYEGSKGVDFTYYFKIRMENHFTDLLRRETNYKRKANEKTIDLEKVDPLRLRKGRRIIDDTPEEAVRVKEAYGEYLTVLSVFEKDVFTARLNNETYDHIARRLSCTREKVENAMSRCREKMKALLIM